MRRGIRSGIEFNMIAQVLLCENRLPTLVHLNYLLRADSKYLGNTSKVVPLTRKSAVGGESPGTNSTDRISSSHIITRLL